MSKRKQQRLKILQKEPNDATAEAFATVGVAILSKIRRTDSSKASRLDSWIDESVVALCGVLRLVTKRLIRVAETGDPVAVVQLWDASGELIKAIHALALQKPEFLKPIARKALFLPSLRAKTKRSFTYNFEDVQKAIELSQACLINTGPKAQYNLDSPDTLLVAEKLESLGLIREKIKEGERQWKELMRRFKLRISLDDWLVEFCGHDRYDLRLRDLPDYDKSSSVVWWENVIKPYLEAPETLDRIRDTPLYAHLSERASKSKFSTKDYAVIDELKKRCRRQVLNSLAPKAGAI